MCTFFKYYTLFALDVRFIDNIEYWIFFKVTYYLLLIIDNLDINVSYDCLNYAHMKSIYKYGECIINLLKFVDL